MAKAPLPSPEKAPAEQPKKDLEGPSVDMIDYADGKPIGETGTHILSTGFTVVTY